MQEIGEGRENGGRGTCGAAASGIALLAGGAALGALLMYLLDPDRGRGRRSRLGDQVTSRVNRLGRAAGAKARDLRNRAQGLMHEAGSILPGGGNSGRDEGTNQEAPGAAGQGA
jgi:hypothetical protein